MKLIRIFGTLLLALAAIGLCSCGSGYLSEAPLEQSFGSVVFSFHASGLSSQIVGSDQSNLTNLSKDFITTDDFNGGAAFDGETLFAGIQIDCQFAAPVLAPIDSDNPGPAAVSVVDDVSSCTDLRNCCVYSVDAIYDDPCILNIECVLDPTLEYLDNTQFDLAFNLRQFMETNMLSGSGLILTAIMEEAETVGAIPIDRDIFALDTATINRSDCVVNTDRFVVNNDDPWANVTGVENGQDILDHGDYLWNVDTIGAVDIVDEFSECTLYYENIMGAVSLAPVANYQTVEEYILIDGRGKICNSLSHTDCEGDGTISFDYTLDMYDPAVYGDDLDFATAGVSHICGNSEPDPCNPSVGFSTCLPYAINGATVPDGCLNLCMDLTGIISWPPDGLVQDPNASLFSQYARDIYDNQGGDYDAACTAANGTLQDIGTGGMVCLPNQYDVCAGGGGGGGENEYSVSDCITVSQDGTGADEDLATYLDYIYQPGSGLDGNNTLKDLYDTCAAQGQDLRLTYSYTPWSVNSSSSECLSVSQRFSPNPDEASPGDITADGSYSLKFVNSGGTEYIKVYKDGTQLYWDLPDGFDSSIFTASVSAHNQISANYEVDNNIKLHTADLLTETAGGLGVCRVADANTYGDLGNGVSYHYLVNINELYEIGDPLTRCGTPGDVSFELYMQATGECIDREEYNRGDTYISVVEEPALAAMATIFGNGTNALNAGAADWPVVSEKTLRDYRYDCVNAGKGPRLAAVPYYSNTNIINTDDSIDDVCRNVVQRFTSTALAAEGTDQVLTPYPLSVEIASAGTSNQGLIISILDGSDTPVFEDITGDYLVGDATRIPTRYYYESLGSTQWCAAGDQRVSCQVNLAASGAMAGHRMSVYTTGGTDYNPQVLDGYVKVGTHLDFHRIRESDLFEPEPENVYLMMIDLAEPIQADGTEASIRCNFEQAFVIDGTCACDIDAGSCP